MKLWNKLYFVFLHHHFKVASNFLNHLSTTTFPEKFRFHTLCASPQTSLLAGSHSFTNFKIQQRNHPECRLSPKHSLSFLSLLSMEKAASKNLSHVLGEFAREKEQLTFVARLRQKKKNKSACWYATVGLRWVLALRPPHPTPHPLLVQNLTTRKREKINRNQWRDVKNGWGKRQIKGFFEFLRDKGFFLNLRLHSFVDKKNLEFL